MVHTREREAGGAMTEIDPEGDIDIVVQEQEMTVRIPLAGQVSQDWCRQYQAMAHRMNVPARAEVHPARAWVIVDLAGDTGPEDARAAMDAARNLIAKTDSAGKGDPEQTAAAIRKWWASQQA
jgi:hypothetical protein